MCILSPPQHDVYAQGHFLLSYSRHYRYLCLWQFHFSGVMILRAFVVDRVLKNVPQKIITRMNVRRGWWPILHTVSTPGSGSKLLGHGSGRFNVQQDVSVGRPSSLLALWSGVLSLYFVFRSEHLQIIATLRVETEFVVNCVILHVNQSREEPVLSCPALHFQIWA